MTEVVVCFSYASSQAREQRDYGNAMGLYAEDISLSIDLPVLESAEGEAFGYSR